MNNVLDVKGYRFFQASYDPDEQGTILSVNRDVAGRNITYTGYLLLVIGLVLCFIVKNTRFMSLSRRLKELHTATKIIACLLFFMVFPSESRANENNSPMMDIVQKHKISPAHAEVFGSLPIQSNSGRTMPINTFSSQILRKIISRSIPLMVGIIFFGKEIQHLPVDKLVEDVDLFLQFH